MNKNLNIIDNELFGKIRTQFPKIKLGDEDSKVTNEPEQARFFKFDYVVNSDTAFVLLQKIIKAIFKY
jgi:hypothetical protein